MEQEVILDELKEIVDRAQGLIAALSATPANEREEAVVLSARTLLWGAKVSLQFRASVIWIEEKLGLDADDLMCCMAFETGQTFSPAVKNLAGSSGTGLIQFMRTTALGLNTTVEALAKMTAVEQLAFVFRYFKAFGSDLSSWELADIYMAILYPKAIGKPLDWHMPWEYGKIAYKQNAGLDLNKDHVITKREAAAGVYRMRELGERFKG